MAARDTTGAVARHHARISRLRGLANRLSLTAEQFGDSLVGVEQKEASAISRLLASAARSIGDETPRVDVEECEREIGRLSKRLRDLIKAVTESVTHHHS